MNFRFSRKVNGLTASSTTISKRAAHLVASLQRSVQISIVTTILACGTVGALAIGHSSPQPGTIATQTSSHHNVTKPTTTAATSSTPTTPTKSGPAVASQPAKIAPTATPSLDETIASINQTLQRYGVIATINPTNNSSSYSTWDTLDDSDAANLQQFADYLTGEFSKYPTDLVANSGLKTVGLVKNLLVSGAARAAAPAPGITSMLYDVDSMDAAGSGYARRVVSHEYWHYLDYKMRSSYYYTDAAWSACNAPGFTYGSGGDSAYGDPNFTNTFHADADMITRYAEYGIEEDRAEMFSWLIYDPSSVHNLNDAGINCKIDRLTQIVHQLSPGLNF